MSLQTQQQPERMAKEMTYNPSLRGHPHYGYKRGLEALVARDLKLGHWSSSTEAGYRTIWHYTTAMLTFRVDAFGNPIPQTPGTIMYISMGHGSVSDQQGMNRLFRALDIPLYFSRKGGADITCTDEEWSVWMASPSGRSRLLAAER